MKVIKSSIILFAFSLVTACAAMEEANRELGQAFSPVVNTDKSKSIVYFYRTSQFFQGATNPPLYVDGELLVNLSDGAYSWIMLEPGKHKIAIKRQAGLNPYGRDIDLDIDVKSGEDMYIRFIFYTGTLKNIFIPNAMTMAAEGVMYPVPAEKALQEIAECRYDKPLKEYQAGK